jgi:hypothetical protein
MTKLKLTLGDVFSIPLGNSEYGFGQVVTQYEKKSGGFMTAIFDFKSSTKDAPLQSVCISNVIFLGFTFDAKIYYKDWIVIGNYTDNIGKIKMPYFRLGSPPDDVYIVNYKGERLKIIEEKFYSELSYRTEIAPIRYENALKSYFNLQEWNNENYGKLLYKHSLKSNEIANELNLINF